MFLLTQPLLATCVCISVEARRGYVARLVRAVNRTPSPKRSGVLREQVEPKKLSLIRIMAKPNEHAITTSGMDYLPQATALHGESFKTDPVINFMLNKLSPEERQPYIPTWMGQLLKAEGLNGGIFDEVDSFASSALWIPPGQNMDNLRTYWEAGLLSVIYHLGISGVKKMLWDYQRRMGRVKADALKKRGWTEYYYLFFISTREEHRGKGLGAMLIDRFQARAGVEGKPIWLEATTEGSMRLYKRLGFQIVDEMVLGEGTADRNGNEENAGLGVRICAMIWEPPTSKSSTTSSHS